MKDYEIFRTKFIPPLVYRDMLDRNLGNGWRSWEPETIRQEIIRLSGIEPSEEAMEKIMALQTFLSTDLFYGEYIPFEKIVLAFNDKHVDPDMVQGCRPEEIAYAVTVASQLAAPKEFGREVLDYIRACHIEAGQLVYHDILKKAQPEYPDEFRRSVAKAVIEVGDDEAEVNLDDPVSVQRAKLIDCYAYVGERLAKAEVVKG